MSNWPAYPTLNWEGLAQAIEEFMDRKRAEQADGGIAKIIPCRRAESIAF